MTRTGDGRDPPTDGRDPPTDDRLLLHATTALSTALLVVAFEWAVTRVFALNFSVAGPGATLLLVVLFVTGWSVPLSARAGDRWSALSTGLVAVAALALAASLVLPMAGALVAAIVAMTALTPVVAALVGRLGPRVALGAAGGVALVQLVRAAQDSVPPYGLAPGQVALVAAAGALVATWWLLRREGALPPASDLASPVDAVWAFLLAEAAYLLSATTVARWTLRPYLLVAVAGAVGLLAGGVVVARGPTHVRDSPVWVAAYAVAVVDLLVVDVTAGASVLLVQAAAVVLLAQAARARRRSALRAAGSLSAVQFAAVLAVLLYVSAVNAPYMPGPLGGLDGLETQVLLAATAVLPALSLLAWATDGGPTQGERPTFDDRRALLGLAAAALGTVVADALQEPGGPGDGPETDELRATTYNVHRFVSATGAGDVSLPAIAEVLRAADPHLVGLQETEGSRITTGAFDGVRWLADRLGYHAVDLTPGNLDTYGVALLSRWPIRDARLVDLPVGASPPRLALVAEVERPSGRLPVVVTHFETDRPGDAQLEEAAALLEVATRFDRAVVLGDFNTRPGEAPYERLAADLTDAWPAARPDADGYTYSARDPDRRIDHVWLHGDWTVLDGTVSGGPAASDHRAVTVTLREP